MFSVRQVQEKCIEQNMDLVAVFIDLTKAFDTVNRETLWVILSKLGCPTKVVNLIRKLHDGMTGQVLSCGEASEPFSISNGVKQGCVLAPVLFNLFFACALNHALRDRECIYDTGSTAPCSTFVDRQPRQRLNKTVLKALFADLQVIVNKFAGAFSLFGLTISIGKTEVLCQPAPTSVALRPTISIDGTQPKTVDDFKYLVSVIIRGGSLVKETSARIYKASQALGHLKTRVLNQHIR